MSVQEGKLIDAIVEAYKAERQGPNVLVPYGESVINKIAGLNSLKPHLHSYKTRIKDPDSLREKLIRKLDEAKDDGVVFDYTPENLFTKVNDLYGIRLLHLYTRQFPIIDNLLRANFEEWNEKLFEEPFARTWDDEYRKLFSGWGIRCEGSDSMYTSVHYVVASGSKSMRTVEIQVRTLMEEVWGEVDHQINYPYECGSLPCREQLRVLARVTSSATRLVDSIFLSLEDHDKTAS